MRRIWPAILLAALVLAAVFWGGSIRPEILVAPETEPPAVTEPVETTAETTEPPTLPPETLPPETVPPETEPAVIRYDAVPLYFQTDYPDMPFGNGTVATSGCSVTCLAMVATYLLDREYTPDQLAYHFGTVGESNMDRLVYGIEQMQLPYSHSYNVEDMFQAVREGKVAIALMNGDSIFTTQQHFIAVTGMGEYGKFLVNDPLEPNYTAGSRHMKESLATGFSHLDLRQGFSGCWIFDKAALGEEPFRFDASLPQPRASRYAGYELTEEDIYTLACFAWAEAREEDAAAKQAVVEVVLNRILSEEYPGTVRAILEQTELSRALEPMTWVEAPGLEHYLAVDAAMYGPYILPDDICFYSEWEKGKEPWGQLGSYTFYKER